MAAPIGPLIGFGLAGAVLALPENLTGQCDKIVHHTSTVIKFGPKRCHLP